jgi:predicted Zn-dependent protease
LNRSCYTWRGFALTALAAMLTMGGACLGSFLVSDAQEVEIGQSVAQELEATEDFDLLNDPEVEGYINGIASQLIPASPLHRDFPFTFKVVDGEMVNAFALPGGFCYVYTGLIQAAETEAELVGVIAHEVSHVTAEHHRAQLANQFLIQTAQGLVFDENSSAVAVTASRLASGLGMLSYGRAQESEADRVGLRTMYNAGWNPRGLRDFFATLQEMEERDPTWVEGMISTHPTNADRIAEIDMMIEQLPPVAGLISDTPQFHLIQERVRSLTAN